MSLAVFALRRLAWTVPLVLGVMLVTFALMRGSGGDPFRPPEGYTPLPPSKQAELRDYYRLDSPWLVEYATYVGHVAEFDFGPSLVLKDTEVTDVITRSFPVTLELVLLAAAFALPAGLALGIVAAVRRRPLADLASTTVSTVLLVLPVFFVAYVLSQYPVIRWGLLPRGWDSAAAKILPTFTLALAPAGYVARLTRTAMLETLQEDYVRTARAKGLRQRRIVLVHVLRNSLGPLLSAAMPMLALLVTGALFVEQFFQIPGAATSFLGAAETRDYPLLLGLTVVLSVVVLTANLLADIALVVVDPRLRERS